MPPGPAVFELIAVTDWHRCFLAVRITDRSGHSHRFRIRPRRRAFGRAASERVLSRWIVLVNTYLQSPGQGTLGPWLTDSIGRNPRESNADRRLSPSHI